MKLSFRLAAAFVAFVVLGSLALVLWLGFEERRQSRERFVEMAKTNAAFIRSQSLPLTERTSEALGKVMGVHVVFLITSQSYGDWENYAYEAIDNGTYAGYLRGEYGEAAFAHISNNYWIHLSRKTEPLSVFAGRPRILAVLSIFWALSLALAWALARGIVRPLRALAARMPRISEEKDEPIPETARTDEIGQLARAYADTRSQLAAERTAREQAERLATLGKMATGLAHEINNPVAAIKLHAQLLEGDTMSAPESRLGIILAETAKIESLVSQWMFLARPQPPQVVECDFAEILAESIRTHAPAADYTRVKITNEVQPGAIIRADRRRLSQAIANVLTNAIHAMSARGGTLRVMTNDECRMTKVLPCEGQFVIRHSSFVISFHDTGPGFTAAALARATELFFSEKEGGMGIGLSVTSEILRAHGGELHIANAPGGGAVVTFTLPTARDA